MPDWMIRVRRLTIAAFAGAAAIAAVARASADQLAMPQTVERGAPVAVTYRFDQPATGRGFLDVVWTDVDGREVVRRHIPLALAGASQVVFHLDMRRAVTVENRLAVHLSLDGVDPGGAPVRRRDDRTLSFVASPPDDGWRDYQIIMWQGQTPAGYDALKRLGITAGVVEANHRSEQDTYAAAELAPLLDHDLRFYLENIATDFYSPYHRWSGDRPVNWRFLAAEALHRQKPGDIAAFMRDPSLSDPAWLAEIRARVTRDVQALRGYRPLYYSLGDETGIADLSSFWDFDFSTPSLAAMRIWLKHRYGGLSALNREWGSRFQRWPDVVPPTTDQAVAQSGQNFAAWADFKEWMDVAFAGALADGTAAVHAADPRALSAIEGAQAPGWGGYDYSRLARSVDVIEPYDHGDNIETLRSLNPRLVLLTTLFVSGAQATYRVWHELLEGTRGLILWDDNHEFAAPDGRIGARGRQAAPYFGEIRGGLGALLINIRRHTDPVAVLYSPASMRVEWLLDRRAQSRQQTGGEAGSRLFGAAGRAASGNFVRILEHLGVQPVFVAAEQVGRGELRRRGFRLLMLPHSLALSRREAAAIRDFVEQGGIAVADGEPGLFDEHGRRAAKPMLSDVFSIPAAGSAAGAAFGAGRALYLDPSPGIERPGPDQPDPLAGRRRAAVSDHSSRWRRAAGCRNP